MQEKPTQALNLPDIVGLVVGAIVGADIYVASAFGSGALGPASLVGWLLAGLMAISIALCFAQCAMQVPRVGGPYAYVGEAFGPLAGFEVGWSLWFAEWVSIAVFPIAFARYLMVFFPHLAGWQIVLAKAAFVFLITASNYVGTRQAGRFNDFLTAAKLVPLLLFMLSGLFFFSFYPALAAGNLLPFTPKGWGGFNQSLVLIFWAYAGFELATIPAAEVKDARRTIPLAILIGMAIVTIFYLLTNLLLLGVMSWREVATSTAPLTSGFQRSVGMLLPGLGGAAAVFMTLGAVVSIAGSDESGTLGTSRLAYAMAVDGHLPAFFSRLHPKYGTPTASLLFQGATAFLASLLGTLGGLIKVAVFFLAVAYLSTALATLKLSRRREARPLRLPGSAVYPYLAFASSALLLSQVGLRQALFGLAMLLAGLLVYAYLSPKSEMEELKIRLQSVEYQRERIERTGKRFLARAVLFCYRALGHPPTTSPR